MDTVEKHTKGALLDRSGSCAIVTLTVNECVYVAHVGDSRAVMSCGGSRYFTQLTTDHRASS